MYPHQMWMEFSTNNAITVRLKLG